MALSFYEILPTAAVVACLSGCGGGGGGSGGDNFQTDPPPTMPPVTPDPPTEPPPDPPDPNDDIPPPNIGEAAFTIGGEGALDCGRVYEHENALDSVPYEQWENCVTMALTQGLPFVGHHDASGTDTGFSDFLAFDGERLFTLYALF